MDLHLPPIVDQRGVFLRCEAIAVGYDDRAIAARVRHHEWVRVRRGAYVGAELWAGLDEASRRRTVSWAALRTARTHVLLSHTTAADELGADVWEPPAAVHLTRTDGRAGRAEAGIRQHRGMVSVQDVTRRGGLWVTTGARTALDITTIADVEHSLVVTDSLLHRGETTPGLLAQCLAGHTFWPDTLHSDLVVRLADGRSESVGETRTRYLCWRCGLPAPEPQYGIRDRTGREVARVDLAWPWLRVFLEFDGKEKYLRYRRPDESVTDTVLREKRREEFICELTGWRCIRIIWSDLYHPERTADRIRALFSPVG